MRSGNYRFFIAIKNWMKRNFRKRSPLRVVFRKPASRQVMIKKQVPTYIRLVSKESILVIVFSLVQIGILFSQQQIYDNFEGNKLVHYREKNGVLDSTVKNPAPNSIDSSARCAMYIRNGTKKFDNIKMSLPKKLSGVTDYATYLGIPPRL